MKIELPKRKQNRLSEFDYGQPGCYFITLCTFHRADLFQMARSEEAVASGRLDSPANQIIHKWIRETGKKFFNLSIDKYMIMADHLHLLVTIKERRSGCSLPDMMRYFKTMTTNEYIRGVRAGSLPAFDQKLWQKSYYDHVIRNQLDYNEIWEYIENNPLKWEIIHNGV